VIDATTDRRGMVLMTLAMACYVLNDTLVKLTLQAFPPGQVLAVRGAAASAVIVVAMWRRTDAAGLRRQMRQPIMVLRCALEISTAVMSVLALARASLGLVSALMMTAPLLIACASVALRWEPTQPRRLLAVLVGLGGAWLVVRPSMQASTAGILFSGLCAVSLAARDMVTRRLPPSMSSINVAFATTLAVCAAGPALGWALQESWSSLLRREALALVGAALCTALGNVALIAACRGADLSLVTPFRYTLLVWACLLGYLVWGDIPDIAAMVGLALIIVGGITNLRAARPP
jgi:drug/metabolite transporter (DMT)-like permease